MGACRTIDPARQAGRQQAPCRGARSDERDHVYFEHGMPVACDPERSAAAQHTFRLSRLVELRTRWIASITRFMWRVGSKANEKPARPPPSSIAKALRARKKGGLHRSAWL